MDIDPVYCEMAIRRLELFRATERTGWQHSNPFAVEIMEDDELKRLVGSTEPQEIVHSIGDVSSNEMGQPVLFG